MTPRRARAPRGERTYGAGPRNWGTHLTLVAALTPAGLGPAMTLPGAVDALAFEAYVREVLDNLGAHKGAVIRRLIETRGCRLLFLPAYSPDLAPIELAFSKIKEALRRTGARTRDALEAAIAAALDTITAHDAAGWFRHCGYPTPDQPL